MNLTTMGIRRPAAPPVGRNRRPGLPLLVTALVIACGSAVEQSAAQGFPTRPVRFIVPFPPGGSQDIIARLTGQRLADRLGQQFVVDNRAGAAGLIAAEAAARAPADGHTILMATAGPITIAPHLHRRLAYDPMRDFAPVIHLLDTPMALIASSALAASTLPAVIELAKSKPGGLNAASTGNGSISHLTLELFKIRTGANLAHVPYKGAAPAFLDLLGGQVQLLFTTTASAQPHTASGKVRAIAVAAKRRSPMMPAAPTMSEAGLSDFEVAVWTGILAPAATPRPVIDTLYREFRTVLGEKEVEARLAQLGSEIVSEGPQPFGAMLKADFSRWAQVIRAANIRLD